MSLSEKDIREAREESPISELADENATSDVKNILTDLKAPISEIKPTKFSSKGI